MRQAAGRVPLRIKLVAALLALVVIALAVISMVGLAQFRSYLQDRTDVQLRALSAQVGDSSGIGGLRSPQFVLEGYAIELRDPQGQQVPGCSWCTSPGDLTGPGPNVPTSKAWLSANNNKLVTLPATSGGDTWRVLARTVSYHQLGVFGPGPNMPGILIVGADLGHLDQAVGWLAKVDLVVSAIIVVALAIVGVAMVRASLRPLTEIEHTAEAIAAGDLSRRVPYYDPRTEMGRLATSLNVMLAHVESAFRARAQSEAAARHSEERMRRFLGDASHELRTPLTAIRGYAEYYRQRGGLKNGSASPAIAEASAAATRPTRPPRPARPTVAAAAAAPAHASALAGSAACRARWLSHRPGTSRSTGRRWTGSWSGSSRNRPGWAGSSRTCSCWPASTSSARSSGAPSTCSRSRRTRSRMPASSRQAGRST